MRLTLDANALRTLIAADPKFHLELQQGVVAEICRRLYPNYVPKDMTATVHNEIRTMVEASIGQLQRGYQSRVQLKPEFQGALNAAVSASVTELLKEHGLEAGKLTEAAAKKAVAQVEEGLDKRVERIAGNRIDRLIEAEVDRRVKAKFQTAMEAMTA